MRLAILEQEGEGCSYTIGCGVRVEEFPDGTTDEEIAMKVAFSDKDPADMGMSDFVDCAHTVTVYDVAEGVDLSERIQELRDAHNERVLF